MLLQILDTWSLRLHVESNKTPRFLGGSLLGVMRELPMFIMPICWFWLVLLWVVITISSVLSSFSFKRLLVIHIFMSLIQASRQNIADTWSLRLHVESNKTPRFMMYDGHDCHAILTVKIYLVDSLELGDVAVFVQMNATQYHKKSKLVQAKTCCPQETIHYLSQC